MTLDNEGQRKLLFSIIEQVSPKGIAVIRAVNCLIDAIEGASLSDTVKAAEKTEV